MELSYADYVWQFGAFRQKELTITQVYDQNYLRERYESIDDKVRLLAALRLDFLCEHIPRKKWFLDYGCGTYRVVEEAASRGFFAFGHDIIPSDHWLQTQFPFQRSPWSIVTFFDSLEHLENPFNTIRKLQAKYVAISVPECHSPDREEWFMKWKHRRPGEHLWHFSRVGLDYFMNLLNYKPLLHSNFEDEVRGKAEDGSSNILSAIYQRIK